MHLTPPLPKDGAFKLQLNDRFVEIKLFFHPAGRFSVFGTAEGPFDLIFPTELLESEALDKDDFEWLLFRIYNELGGRNKITKNRNQSDCDKIELFDMINVSSEGEIQLIERIYGNLVGFLAADNKPGILYAPNNHDSIVHQINAYNAQLVAL